MRAPARLLIGGLVALGVGGATHGWGTVPDILPIPVILVVAFYVWGGRESDLGAALRSQLDERQAHQRLKIQALVGRVLSLGVALAYIAAAATKTVLWPWAALLGVTALTLLIGWLVYGERGGDTTG
jgi:hypothetical protein